MKALSIRQPWAWLIANGFKDIENRTWPTHYRGTFFIHAGKGMTQDEYHEVKSWLSGDEEWHHIQLPKFEELARGGIVGVATLTDCIPGHKQTSRWHFSDQFGFQIQDAKPIEMIPLKGQLSFFNIPQNIQDIALSRAGVHKELS